jgi:hypothetical protein
VTYRSEPLNSARQRLDSLDSGEPELDTWPREQVIGAQARRVARTFVWCETGDERYLALGYYSVVGHRLIRDDLPTGLGRGSPVEIPAVLLARLAFDASSTDRASAASCWPTPCAGSSPPPTSWLLVRRRS